MSQVANTRNFLSMIFERSLLRIELEYRDPLRGPMPQYHKASRGGSVPDGLRRVVLLAVRRGAGLCLQLRIATGLGWRGVRFRVCAGSRFLRARRLLLRH